MSTSAWVLSAVALQDLWRCSALRTGLALAPGPLTSALFAVNGGRITARWAAPCQRSSGRSCQAGTVGAALSRVALRRN